MKKVLVILGVMVICPAVMADFLPSIPKDTLDAAREAEILEAFERPKSEIVRVGIGDSSFKQYDYAETNIFGTSYVEIYDDTTLIKTVPADTVVNVKLQSGMFVISTDESSRTSILPSTTVRESLAEECDCNRPHGGCQHGSHA